MAPLPHIERVARAFINYANLTSADKLPDATKDPEKYLKVLVKAKFELKKELKNCDVSQMFDWGIDVMPADPLTLKGVTGLSVLNKKPVETKAPAKTQTPPIAVATKPVLLISPKVQTKTESKKAAPVVAAKMQTPAKVKTKPEPVKSGKAKTQTLAKKQVFSKGLFGKPKPATSVARHA